jgi:hypothetical protein
MVPDPIALINNYINEIQGSIENQDAQIRIAQQAIKEAEEAKAVYGFQIGALREAATRIANG